ncbi:hypothetical protein O4H52_03010 [Sphingomonadaceae bacterium G21617-S1]|nr:hypothetical protein [Sphingomonadaceae bacterium G21617-S1]
MDKILTLFTSRIALTQLVGIAFALLAAIGVAIPAGFDPPSVVAVLMLAIAAVTAVLRFGHIGQPAADAKTWWQSKIIWTQIASAIVAVLVLFRVVPAGFDPSAHVEGLMALIGLITLAFRLVGTSKPIG